MTAQTASDADRRRRFAVAISLAAAAVFSTAGLFARSIDADPWAINFWRAFFAGLFTLALVAARGGLKREFAQMGLAGLGIGAVSAAASACFIPALKFTTIANVALIYATTPFLAAFGAWAWYRERPRPAVLAAGATALAGAALIVGDSLGGAHWTGDVLAVAMTVLFSAVSVLYRRFPSTPAWGPTALSSFLLLAPGLTFGDPLHVAPSGILLLCLWGALYGASTVAFAEGARHLPPSEAALISSMETPLAPLWAWLAFSEAPSRAAMVGGGMILAAIIGSQWGAWRAPDPD